MPTLFFSVLSAFFFISATGMAQEQPSSSGTTVSNEELRRRLDTLAQEIDRIKMGEAGARADRSDYGLGAGASKVYRAGDGVSLGGYGEFRFEHQNRTRAGERREPDRLNFTRMVVYIGYKFDEQWLWNSEIEIENATTEAEGAVGVEFGYLDRLMAPGLNVRVGKLLIPMGFINELHEPNFYLGTKRPATEALLIPTTWGENGVGVFGSIGALSYKSYVVAGLNASNFEGSGIREGRQAGSESNAQSWASVSRLDYTGFASGLLAGVSAYIGDSSTELAITKGGGRAIPTRIFDAHIDWRWRGLQSRLLKVVTRLGRIDELNRSRNLGLTESIGSGQEGGYVEFGYDLLEGTLGRSLIPFARWESYDTQKSVSAGYTKDPVNAVRTLTLGINFRPIQQIVLKADYKAARNDFDSGLLDEFGMGAGYVF